MQHPEAPHSYPRRILLSVTGMSPQVITETLYALSVKPNAGAAPFVPTEVRLITTTLGFEQATLNLLSDQPGWFRRLREDYALPEIHFTTDCIEVITGADGKPLADIRTPEHNELAADFITRVVRQLTTERDTALHVSIAGGRKTMGFYLGYALSLFARPQDRLSHVLVSHPYESNPDFYYPTPYQHILQSRLDPPLALDAARAEVSLAEIPFVSLRHGLEGFLEGATDFRATVAAARRALSPPALSLDVLTHTVTAAGKNVALTPTEFALIAVFAWRACDAQPALAAPIKDQPDPAWSAQFLRDLSAACGATRIPEHLLARLGAGVDGNFFSQHLSRLHRKLRQALGPAASPYLIANAGGKARRFSLAIPAEAILWEHKGIQPSPVGITIDANFSS